MSAAPGLPDLDRCEMFLSISTALYSYVIDNETIDRLM